MSTDSQTAADSAGYFGSGKVMVSPNTGALRRGMSIHRRADPGGGDDNVAAITAPVSGGGTGLSERQEFFKYIRFILEDEMNMPALASPERQAEV